jgi:hypothetical protein
MLRPCKHEAFVFVSRRSLPYHTPLSVATFLPAANSKAGSQDLEEAHATALMAPPSERKRVRDAELPNGAPGGAGGEAICMLPRVVMLRHLMHAA